MQLDVVGLLETDLHVSILFSMLHFFEPHSSAANRFRKPRFNPGHNRGIGLRALKIARLNKLLTFSKYVDLGPGPNSHTWGAALLSKVN